FGGGGSRSWGSSGGRRGGGGVFGGGGSRNRAPIYRPPGGGHFHRPSGGHVHVQARPRYVHPVSRVHVHGWHHHYAPVYMYGYHTPIITSPILTGALIVNYHGFAAGHAIRAGQYDYYYGREHLPKSAQVQCSRPGSELAAADQEKLKNATSNLSKEIAWTCPAKYVCCDWECCKDPDHFKYEDDEEEGLTTLHWVLIGIGILILLIIIVAIVICAVNSVRQHREMVYAPRTPAAAACAADSTLFAAPAATYAAGSSFVAAPAAPYCAPEPAVVVVDHPVVCPPPYGIVVADPY
ncbi:hypothetical protein PFISCL1PPCAC_25885, partial [Pristionchus fissidentatus]